MKNISKNDMFSCIYPGFKKKRNGQHLFYMGVNLTFSVKKGALEEGAIYLKHGSIYNYCLEVKARISVYGGKLKSSLKT